MGLDDVSYLEKIQSSTAYKVGRGIVEWSLEKLWPVYSLGMVVAAVSLVGAVHEKSVLADHFYGSVNSETIEKAAETAQSSLDDETTALVRHEVFQYSRDKFRAQVESYDL